MTPSWASSSEGVTDMKEKLALWLKSAPKISHTIRVLAGGYLIYLSYGMFTDPSSNINALVVICGILFVIIGLFFLSSSLIALNKGLYSDYVDFSSVPDDDDEEEPPEEK